VRAWRSSLPEINCSLNIIFLSLEEHLHSTIGQVPHPADEAKATGDLGCFSSKEDSLDPAADEDVYSGLQLKLHHAETKCCMLEINFVA
jgi:hypothetical protein